MKAELKKFTKHIFGKERIHVDETRKALLDCQCMIDQFPNDLSIRAQENDLMTKFLDAIRIEEEVAKQKSRTSGWKWETKILSISTMLLRVGETSIGYLSYLLYGLDVLFDAAWMVRGGTYCPPDTLWHLAF